MSNENSINPADRFEEAIDILRDSSPLVGLAALSGKTPNPHLHQSWKALNSVGVNLERGTLNYMWGDLRKTNPKLAHSVEEVLIFGDALFSAIARRESPETLRDEFIDVKQRFAKVINETEQIASPKEERRLLSFFTQSSSEDQNNKTALRLDNLDNLLNQAHEKSKELLEKTEKDLFVERGFQNAVGSYILALEEVQEKLDKESRPGGELTKADAQIITGLKTALLQSVLMTKNNFEISKSHLQTKAALHDTSISFLTMHENTFTFIQGQLHALSDIKKLTDTMNSLSDVANAGSTIISSASVGVEKAIIDWNEPFVSRDTLKKLSSGFDSYDKTVNNLISRLTPQNQEGQDSKGPVLSHWDNLDEVKKELIEPILSRNIKQENTPVAVRPTRRSSAPVKDDGVYLETSSSEGEVWSTWLIESYDEKKKEQKVELEIESKPAKSINDIFEINSSDKPWNKIQSIVAQRAIDRYNELVDMNMSADKAKSLNWSAMETVARLSSTIDKLNDLNRDISNIPLPVRSKIDYITLYKNPLNEDFKEIISENPLIFYDDSWKKDFISWHSKFDDLDYSYIMQWNELVYDLLILDEDSEQRKEILNASDEDKSFKSIKNSIINRIESFASDHGLEDSKIREWSFNGLILRYGIDLGISPEKLKPLWNHWYNPVEPIDWDGSSVSSWRDKMQNPDNLNDFIKQIDLNNNIKLDLDDGFSHVSEINASSLKSKVSNKEKKESQDFAGAGLSSEEKERYNKLNLKGAYVGLSSDSLKMPSDKYDDEYEASPSKFLNKIK